MHGTYLLELGNNKVPISYYFSVSIDKHSSNLCHLRLCLNSQLQTQNNKNE